MHLRQSARLLQNRVVGEELRVLADENIGDVVRPARKPVLDGETTVVQSLVRSDMLRPDRDAVLRSLGMDIAVALLENAAGDTAAVRPVLVELVLRVIHHDVRAVRRTVRRRHVKPSPIRVFKLTARQHV